MTSIYGGFFTFFIIIIFYGISSFYVLLEFNFLLYSVLSGGLSCVAFNFAQIAFTIKVDMSKIVNVFYIQVPLSSLLGFFLFGETITFFEIIGGLTIIFTVLYVNVFSK